MYLASRWSVVVYCYCLLLFSQMLLCYCFLSSFPFAVFSCSQSLHACLIHVLKMKTVLFHPNIVWGIAMYSSFSFFFFSSSLMSYSPLTYCSPFSLLSSLYISHALHLLLSAPLPILFLNSPHPLLLSFPSPLLYTLLLLFILFLSSPSPLLTHFSPALP